MIYIEQNSFKFIRRHYGKHVAVGVKNFNPAEIRECFFHYGKVNDINISKQTIELVTKKGILEIKWADIIRIQEVAEK